MACPQIRFGRIQWITSALLLWLAAGISYAALPQLDGTVVSIQSQQAVPGRASSERLIRYDIIGGATAGQKVIHQTEGKIIDACLSPFGNQVAFIRPGGVLAVIDIDGGEVRDLVQNVASVQWPAGDGGRWVYFIDAKARTNLWRVNVRSGASEPVITFGRNVPQLILSPDAEPLWGKCLVDSGDAYTAIYHMSKGDGDLHQVPLWRGGAFRGISPDGSAFITSPIISGPARPNYMVAALPPLPAFAAGYRLDRQGAMGRFGGQRLGADDGTENGITKESLDPIWSVNENGWIVWRQDSYRVDEKNKRTTIASDVVLQDLLYAHHGIQDRLPITRNAEGTFDRPVGFWANRPWRESLGFYRGEAPLTLEFDDQRLSGDWTWDFGDQTPKATGRTARHTFESPGLHTVLVTQGSKLFEGRVTVLPQQAPTATAYWVDSRHVLVEFSEPLRQEGDAIQVSLTSGTQVENVKLIDSGRRMAIQLAAAMAGPDKIRVAGLVDLAQRPNTLSAEAIEVIRPAWPADRTDLLFLWEDAFALNLVFDKYRREIRRVHLRRDAMPAEGSFDRFGRMTLGSGGGAMTTDFTATGIGMPDFGEIPSRNMFTFEFTMQPDNLTQQITELPPRIMTIGAHRPNNWRFLIGQQADILQVGFQAEDTFWNDHGVPETPENMIRNAAQRALRGADRKGIEITHYGRARLVDIARLTDTNPHHVVVTYQPGELSAYIDGRQVYHSDRIKGELVWRYGPFVLGGHHHFGGSSELWQGKLEGVAVYSRVLDAQEVQKNYQLYARKMQARGQSASPTTQPSAPGAAEAPTLTTPPLANVPLATKTTTAPASREGQSPSAHLAAQAALAWPAVRDGLAYAYVGFAGSTIYGQAVIAFDAKGAASETGTDASFAAQQGQGLLPRGNARYSGRFSLLTHGGSFEAAEGAAYLLESVGKSGSFAAEVFFTPATRNLDATGTILWFGPEGASPNLALQQKGKQIVLSLLDSKSGTKTAKLLDLTDESPHHLLVSFADGKLTAMVDGREAINSATLGVDLSTWRAGRIIIGDTPEASSNWPGQIDALAIYSTALSPAQMRQEHEACRKVIDARKRPPVVKMQAILKERSELPTLRSIEPYARALVVYEYEVQKVTEGKYDQPLVRVAHWAILDRQTLGIASRNVGQKAELALEPFADNPQLERDNISDTLEINDVPLMYDVQPPDQIAK